MKTIFTPRRLAVTVIFLSLLAAGLNFGRETASAAIQNPAPQAKVSFTFDDGGSSNINKAAPVLAQYGITGTSYITTSCVGMVTVPNKCAADSGIPYMTWAQIKSLQNTYGWEIGSHSVSHPLMTEISATKLEQEVAKSKSTLQAQGINATSFATPYGDYNEKVIAAIAKYYSNHRPYHDTGYNIWPYNNYLLRVQQVQIGVSVETVKGYIDQAVAENTWLILVFHDIQDNPSTDPADYQYSTSDLSAIASYIKSSNVATTNISTGLVNGGSSDNLVTNPISGNNLGNGWTTDGGTSVKVDTTTKGNAPEAKSSLKITSNSSKNLHVFTPLVSVNPKSTYVVKAYVNVTTLTTGAVGFYIDEYDVNGNWISGQYKQTIDKLYIKDLSFAYSATSTMVAKARLQVIMMAANGTIVYIDSVQWLEAIPGPAPEPEAPNLLVNGTFDSTNGWTTDASQNIVIEGGKAVLQSQSTGNAHLFSHTITVESSRSYSVSYEANVSQSNDEIGFYIDEYDVNGNWISGKYICAVRGTGLLIGSCGYVPTSNNVVSASLQIIVPGGGGIQATIDNLKWHRA